MRPDIQAGNGCTDVTMALENTNTLQNYKNCTIRKEKSTSIYNPSHLISVETLFIVLSLQHFFLIWSLGKSLRGTKASCFKPFCFIFHWMKCTLMFSDCMRHSWILIFHNQCAICDLGPAHLVSLHSTKQALKGTIFMQSLFPFNSLFKQGNVATAQIADGKLGRHSAFYHCVCGEKQQTTESSSLNLLLCVQCMGG